MVHIMLSDNGQYYFTVTARNGQVLVTSETYTTKYNAQKGFYRLFEMMQYNTKLERLRIVDHTKQVQS